MSQKKVLICGYYGHCNLGDEAMLSGLLKLLKRLQPNLVPTVLSSNATSSKRLHLINAINQGGNFIDKLRRLISYIRSDYFILGGGDLLRDTPQTSIASSWLSSLQKAIKFRCHTIVIGISVGEIWREETQKLIPKVLNQVDYIGVRDFQSKLKLENLGVHKKIHIVNDLALENLPEKSLDYLSKEKKQIKVGIAARSLAHRGASINPQAYSNVVKEIAALLDLLIENYDLEIHMLPFQASKDNNKLDNDDYACSLEIQNLSNYSDKFLVHRCFESVQEYVAVSTELDIVIGMRLHALILSAGLGIPIIGIEYDPKVHYFMEEINQLEYTTSLNCLDKDYLLSITEKILQDLPGSKKKLIEGVSSYRNSEGKSFYTLKKLLLSNSNQNKININS